MKNMVKTPDALNGFDSDIVRVDYTDCSIYVIWKYLELGIIRNNVGRRKFQQFIYIGNSF